jgi:hypothetical protein
VPWVQTAKAMETTLSTYDSVFCDHTAMREHCNGCGHYECPCGILWDDGAEGGGPHWLPELDLEDLKHGWETQT